MPDTKKTPNKTVTIDITAQAEDFDKVAAYCRKEAASLGMTPTNHDIARFALRYAAEMIPKPNGDQHE